MRQPRFTAKTSRLAFFGFVLVLFFVTAWLAKINDLERESKRKRSQLETLTVEELLDLLVLKKPREFSLFQAHRLYPFGSAPVEPAAEDSYDPLVTELAGYPQDQVSPIQVELVRRGLAAIPQLLEHLEDKRPTRWEVNDKDLHAWMAYGKFYDPRIRKPGKQPPGTVPWQWVTDLTFPDPGPEDLEFTDPPLSSHTLTVGDLCYIALGEIVNRRLHVAKYTLVTFASSITIQSPVHTPALAKACRDDWSGLTPEKHRQSLLNDANHHDFVSLLDAIDRLAYYYPQEAEDLLVKLLKRPIYDVDKVLEFINSKLLALSPSHESKLKNYFYISRLITYKIQETAKSPFLIHSFDDTEFIENLSTFHLDENQLHQFAAMQITKINNPNHYLDLIEKFKGESKDHSWITLPYWLHHVCQPDFVHTDILLFGKAALANQISALAFPDYDPLNPYYMNAVSVEDQTRLLMLLRPIMSPRVDQAIHELFRKAIQPNSLFDDSPDWGGALAKQCVKHLAGKSYDPELRAYLESQIKKLKEHPDPEETQWERKNLERLLQHLRN